MSIYTRIAYSKGCFDFTVEVIVLILIHVIGGT